MRSIDIRRARRVLASCSCGLFVAALHCAAAAAQGTDGYPISGTATIHGQSGALPADGTFSGSSYDPLTGAIGAGTFKFPATTVTQASASLTYQLSQTGPSSATVDDSGNVVFTPATMALTLLGGTFPPYPAATFGDTCIFAPIAVGLTGSASPAGLDVTDAQFTIPSTVDNCNGFGNTLNGYIPGTNNAITIHVEGDFTPPGVIFTDGFDGR